MYYLIILYDVDVDAAVKLTVNNSTLTSSYTSLNAPAGLFS